MFRLTNTAVKYGVSLPTKASRRAAGHDFYMPCNIVLLPNSITQIKSGVCCVQYPEGTYLQLIERSSKTKYGFSVLGGVCDPDYHKELIFTVRNASSDSIYISSGERWVQGIFVYYVNPVELGHLMSNRQASGASGN